MFNRLLFVLNALLLLSSALVLILIAPSPISCDDKTLATTTTTTNNNNKVDYKLSTQTENIAIGNTNNNNYNFQQSQYQPTQLTQVVLNVPKPKKLRIARPPTEEEFSIKNKILDVYDAAKRDAFFNNNNNNSNNNQLQSSINFEHLGRIIQALNPKYIATERVRRVAFGDPADPTTLIPLPNVRPEPLSSISLKGSAANESPLMIIEQLDALNQQFRSQVSWDLQFINSLVNINDLQLNQSQLAFKRLLLCLTQQAFCQPPEANGVSIQQEQPLQQQQQSAQLQQNVEEEDSSTNQQSQYLEEQAKQQQQDLYSEQEMVASASQPNQVYAKPPPQFQQQQQQQFQQQQVALPERSYPNQQQQINIRPIYSSNSRYNNRPYALNNVAPRGDQTPVKLNSLKNAYSPPNWIYQKPKQYLNGQQQQQQRQRQRQIDPRFQP